MSQPGRRHDTSCSLLAYAMATQHRVKVSAVLFRQYCVQVRVGAGIQRIDKDEQNFRMGYVDQRVTDHCSQSEESNGRQAGQISEDQQGHFFGHFGVRVRRKRVLTVANGMVHVAVKKADGDESQSVAHQQ